MKTQIGMIVGILAVILIATSQSAAAFSWVNNGYNLENAKYPNGIPCYKTKDPRACYKGLPSELINSDDVDINTKSTNNQDGLINQNSQVNMICIAWTCTQYSNNEQKVNSRLTGDDNREYDIEAEDDGQIYLQSMEKVNPYVDKLNAPLKVNVILTYKNAEKISGDILKLTAYDARGGTMDKRIDLMKYKLDGRAIKISFEYSKDQVPSGSQGQVCVSNLSEIGSSYNCAGYINGVEKEPENVKLSIPT